MNAVTDPIDAADLFVWPPQRADEPVRIDAPTEAPPPVHGRGPTRQAESDLLGVRSLSFARWAAATGWRADGFGAFCWRCADSVGPHEVDGSGCGSCRDKRLAWDRAARLGVYEGGVRSAVMELKFGRWRRTGAELGRAMGERLREVMDAGGFRPDEVVIVPVPASWRRRMERGIDHTRVLAIHAGARAGVPVVRGLARRHAPPQVGLSATARAANMRGVFRPRPALEAALGRGKGRGGEGSGRIRAVVVLDDVRTTGATMTAACRSVRSLIGKSVEVWALTAVVATDRRGRGAGDAGLGGGSAGEHEKIAKSFVLAV